MTEQDPLVLGEARLFPSQRSPARPDQRCNLGETIS